MYVGPDEVHKASIYRLNFDTSLWSVETIFEIPGWAIRLDQVCFAMTSTVTNIK
jgi:hypothetical protein